VAERTSHEFWQNMGLGVVFAVLLSRLGLAWGEGMRKVQR
jgi:hypothetical protein